MQTPRRLLALLQKATVLCGLSTWVWLDAWYVVGLCADVHTMHVDMLDSMPETTLQVCVCCVLHYNHNWLPCRNPFFPKYFLSLSDWSARVWNEDLRTPLMTSKYASTYITGGTWSPTRPGVFFTTQKDGCLNVWDLFYKHNEPTLQVGQWGEKRVKLLAKGGTQHAFRTLGMQRTIRRRQQLGRQRCNLQGITCCTVTNVYHGSVCEDCTVLASPSCC